MGDHLTIGKAVRIRGHEYFANGVLVHNCVDSTRYAMEDDIGKDNIDINPSIFTGFGGMKEEEDLW